ncbi:MAG: hypothetical protein AB8G14_12225 [Ilumatobacter sp.]
MQRRPQGLASSALFAFCAAEALALAFLRTATATAPLDVDDCFGDARCDACGRRAGADCADLGHLGSALTASTDAAHDRELEPLAVNG